MQVYQKREMSVKECVRVIDAEAIMERASEGLLNLSVELGLGILEDIFEHEVAVHAGKKGQHDKNRAAYRHGTEKTKVVLGGRKVEAERPRVRAKDGSGEIPLSSLAAFQREDPLNNSVLATLLAGVSCRKYARIQEPGVAKATCISKSEVSRRFQSAMKTAMNEFFGRRIEGSYPAMMIDGIELGRITVVAAMGIRSDGRKQMLGLVEGGSENSMIVKSLLADMIERGLDPTEPRLYTIDGGKALAKGVKDTFGEFAIIQRCQVHKKRNVLSHLPESEKSLAGKKISLAYMEHDAGEAERRLRLLERELRLKYPSAANSLLEGLDETLSVHRLQLPGLLRQTLASTNAIESANSVCAGVIRRVSNFKTGEMAIQQAAAGFMEAERCFRRIKGYREMPLLQAALAKAAPHLTAAEDVDKMGIA
jgi:transposase-like protein